MLRAWGRRNDLSGPGWHHRQATHALPFEAAVLCSICAVSSVRTDKEWLTRANSLLVGNMGVHPDRRPYISTKNS